MIATTRRYPQMKALPSSSMSLFVQRTHTYNRTPSLPSPASTKHISTPMSHYQPQSSSNLS